MGRAASRYAVFGGEIVKRLEHQMHEQRSAMNQLSNDAC
jgi:hypothetical protein